MVNRTIYHTLNQLIQTLYQTQVRPFIPRCCEAKLGRGALDFLQTPAVRVLLSTAHMHWTVMEWLRAGLVKATSAPYPPHTTTVTLARLLC